MAAAATVAASCGADQAVLTLVFQHVPADAKHIEVTLHGQDATFMGPDAGNSQVGVRYAGGDVHIAIDPAYAAARANRIRLPLTAAKDITLEGTASAMGDGEPRTAVMSTPVAAHQSATLTFDFGIVDGGDGGAPDGGGTEAGAETGLEAGVDSIPDAQADGGADVGDDGSRDVPADMSGTDTSGDTASHSDVADVADVAADKAPPPDAGGDAPAIATSCAITAQFPASVVIGGAGPTVAHASGLFGVAWKASNGDILYNAVSAGGTLQNAADKTLVLATGQTVSGPRLAAVGADFVMAFGRRDSSGAQAAAIRVSPATGTVVAGPTMGMNRAGASAAPDVGDVAVSGDGRRIAVISRPPDLATQTAAIVDAFDEALAAGTGRMPAALGATRMTGIAWTPGRFFAGAVTEATSSGGLLLDFSDDSTLQVGVTHPFTSGTAAPVVGSSAATIALAGASDRVAVAWVALQSAQRVITVAALPFSTATATPPVAASATTGSSRYYPHIVFDGASFTVAWLEGSSAADSQIVVRRFDTNLTPVGTPLTVGAGASINLGDFDLTPAGPNVYGVATAISGGTQRLFIITCT